MKVVLQRVRAASVVVDGQTVGEIGLGLVALVGVGQESTMDDAAWLADKTTGLRIFSAPDGEPGKMQASVADVGGAVLAISQFTLYADTRKGRRPSFVQAADPEHGDALYRAYCDALGVPVETGVFGAMMDITMQAFGPVTITLERASGRTSAG